MGEVAAVDGDCGEMEDVIVVAVVDDDDDDASSLLG